MAQKLNLVPRGLVTDPNELSTAPEGSLKTAKNVVIQRSGVVEPRPGFTSTQLHASLLDGDAAFKAEIFTTGNRVVYAIDNGKFWSSGAGAFIDDVDGNDIDFGNASPASIVPMQGSLYFSMDGEVYRYSGSADTSARVAGMPVGTLAIFNTATGSVYSNNEMAKYRIVFGRELDDGRLLLGPPGPPVLADNTSGSGKDMTVTIPIPNEMQSGDFVRLYRTNIVATSAEISSEYFLVTEQTINSGGGNSVLSDSVANANLGTPLYTNPTQDGEEQANFRPPKCGTMSEFNQMMFYGNTTEFHTVTLTLADYDSFVNDPAVASLDVTTDGDTTVQIDGGLNGINANGYIITDRAAGPKSDGTHFASDSIIDQGTTSSVLTLDQAALSSASPTGMSLYAYVKVDSNFHYYHVTTSGSEDTSEQEFADITVTGLTSTAELMYSLARIINRTNPDISVFVDYETGDLILSRTSPTQDTIDIEAPTEIVTAFHPDLGDTNYGQSALQSVATTKPGRVFYSKLNNPDAVPLNNWFDVGDTEQEVLGFGRTRSSLFIFKEDGTWILTGRTPATLRLEEYDRSLRLINANCIAEMNNAVFAWTTEGIVQMTEAGYESISDPVIEDSLRGRNQAWLDNATGYGAFLVAQPEQNQLYFGASTTGSGSSDVGDIYVYNAKTGAWSTWDLPQKIIGAYYNWGTQKLNFLGEEVGARAKTFTERRAVGSATTGIHTGRFADYSDTATMSAFSSGTVTLSGAPSDFTIEVGDLIIDQENVAAGIVTAVASQTSFTVEAEAGFGGTPPTAVTFYKAFESIVEFVANSNQNPALEKKWGDLTWFLTDYDYLTTITLSHESELVTAATTLTPTFSYSATALGLPIRTHVPTDHTRNAILYPKYSIKQAGADWELRGIGLTYRDLSTRVGN